MKHYIFILISLFTITFFTSCKDEKPNNNIDIWSPHANFTYEIDGLTVTFRNKTTHEGTEYGGTTIYTWYFGDGKHENSYHVTHTYPKKDIYKATLVVSSTYWSIEDEHFEYIDLR